MRTNILSASLGLCLSLLVVFPAPSSLAAKEEQTAQQLIRLLQVGRTEVSNHQDLINDPDTADKGFTGDYLRGRMRQLFHQETGIDPAVPDGSFRSELFLALLESAKAVIDIYQPVINKQGIGFKGVLPAVFARRVGEEFYERTGVRLKLTATEVRYPANKPDGFEEGILKVFSDPNYPKGKQYSKIITQDGRRYLRMMDPEYASESCLKCHGEPRGERDITGMKKEGYKQGDLAGAISLTLPLK